MFQVWADGSMLPDTCHMSHAHPHIRLLSGRAPWSSLERLSFISTLSIYSFHGKALLCSSGTSQWMLSMAIKRTDTFPEFALCPRDMTQLPSTRALKPVGNNLGLMSAWAVGLPESDYPPLLVICPFYFWLYLFETGSHWAQNDLWTPVSEDDLEVLIYPPSWGLGKHIVLLLFNICLVCICCG